MPIFESACTNQECEKRHQVIEHYYKFSGSPMQACESCGGPTTKVISSFNHGLMGNIERRHMDRETPGFERLKDGGHWVYERNTPDGKPQPKYISTFQEQREHCKREGLANPSDLSKNFEVGSDGKTVKNTVGMPGCWV